MRGNRFKNINDVVKWRLCLGCGACAYACPRQAISMIDKVDEGLRPKCNHLACCGCRTCLLVCPGIDSSKEQITMDDIRSDGFEWGKILEIWEGYAIDSSLRIAASSGGAATAIALYCLEKGGMRGVLHTVPFAGEPLKNDVQFSLDRHSMLKGIGSRYSPSAPCSGLQRVEKQDGKCIFIAKGCDIAGLRKCCQSFPSLKKKIGISIGIFCAGTPSTAGTLSLLSSMCISPNELRALRYRGYGWPGYAVAQTEKGECKLSYMDAWGLLQKYRPFRCYLCADGTSEQADISCGDAWYRISEKPSDGLSLILVRTELGRRVITAALSNGYLQANRVSINELISSQKNILVKKRNIYGRILALKTFGLPYPKYEGYFLKESWHTLSLIDKCNCFLQTIKRIVRRRYYLGTNEHVTLKTNNLK
jgi:coenzyme F420 hydrogenase subunit beta